MFVGRKKELKLLDELINSKKFEMLIMHGRRRVGKSYLLSNFANKYIDSTIFFTVDKSNEKSNVKRFINELKKVVNVGDYINSIESWNDLFSLLNDVVIDKRLMIIIDEFTYLYNSNSAFDSILQNAIDNIFKKKNIFLILCGSEVSVIEEIIDNSSKPLYGRKTCDLKIEPFTYYEAKEFFPNYTNEEVLIVYSILGGIPLYLSLFDDTKSIKENIIRNCLSTNGYLFNEPNTVLRMELNETQFYKDIMIAISSGSSTFNDISTKIYDEKAKVAKYLKVLINLGIIEKEVPCGEKENSRNSLYKIADNYFAFWFKFIYKNQSMLNGLIDPKIYYDLEINKENLNRFLGYRFEKICMQYLKKKSYEGKLGFYPYQIGRWWGNNKVLKKEDEIDIIALGKEKILLSECKYTSSLFDNKELNDLLDSSKAFNNKIVDIMIFSKSGFTKEVIKRCNDNNYKMINLDNLFDIN